MVGKQKEVKKVNIGTCKCNGEKCQSAFGWVWKTGDLGNSVRVGGERHKAGRTWAEPCPQWDGVRDENGLPPAPQGVLDMKPYLTPKWRGVIEGYKNKESDV